MGPTPTYEELENRFKALESKLEEFENNQHKSEMTEHTQCESLLSDPQIWIENSPVCTKILDPDFNLQYMSNSGVKDLNIEDITEYYGHPYPFHFYPDSFKIPMISNLKKLKETGEIIELEASTVNLKGEIVWYHSTLILVKDHKSQLDFILIVSLNTTERKRAEEKLKQINEELLNAKEKAEERGKRFKELFEGSGDAILILENERFTACNQKTIEMLQYSTKEEFLNVHPAKLSPERQPDGKRSVEKANEMMEIALKNGTHRFEWNHLRNHGEAFPVEVRLTAISNNPDQRIIHAVWIDLTEKNNNEHKLLKANKVAEEKTLALIERVKELNCFYSISKIVESVDLTLDDILEQIAKILPVSFQYPKFASSKITLKDKEYCSPNYKKSKLSLKKEIISHEKQIGFVKVNYSNSPQNSNLSFLKEEYYLIKAVSERIGRITERKELEVTLRLLIESQDALINMKTSELRFANKKLTCKIGEGKVKEKKLAAHKIQLSAELAKRLAIENALKETNKSLQDMVHIASHDLQVPLVSMEGYATELLEGNRGNLDDESIYCLTRLKANAQRMHKLVLSLLDISRLNTKRNPRGIFSLETIIKKILGDIALTVETHKATIKIGKLPKLFADKQRMEIVFRNLIVNSLNYEGNNIEIDYSDNVVSIIDNGIGIPPTQLDDIFNPGKRLKITKAEGVGMGLTFCKKVIEQHNSKIWAESDGKNKGTKINIEFDANILKDFKASR